MPKKKKKSKIKKKKSSRKIISNRKKNSKRRKVTKKNSRIKKKSLIGKKKQKKNESSSQEVIFKTRPEWIKTSLANKSQYQNKYNESIKNNNTFWKKEGKRVASFVAGRPSDFRAWSRVSA